MDLMSTCKYMALLYGKSTIYTNVAASVLLSFSYQSVHCS